MPFATYRSITTVRGEGDFGRRTTPSPILTMWKRVRGFDGGAHCGDVIVTRRIADGRIGIVVADVAGRGPSCTSVGTRVAERILSLLELGFSPRFALEIVDAGLRRELEADDETSFVASFVAIVDIVRHALVYASAGHETALLVRADGTHAHLSTNGPAIGILNEPNFGEATVAFTPGESLVVVTDGVTDSRPNAHSAFFGSSGVIASVRRSLRSGANAAYFLVHDAVRHARGWHADDTSAFVATLQRG